MEKVLGKIDFAEFGKVADYPFLIGLQLGFSMGGSGVMDGGKYTVNISKDCKWENAERTQTIVEKMEFVNKILSDAKVRYVSDLIGKPVEVILDRNMFYDFRILTEVL